MRTKLVIKLNVFYFSCETCRKKEPEPQQTDTGKYFTRKNPDSKASGSGVAHLIIKPTPGGMYQLPAWLPA